jgi:polysaccharide biosynthesis transport protein
MNPANHPAGTAGGSPSPGMTLDDVVFLVFRQKWLILAFVCLGIIGAIAVRVMRPPMFVSKAKLMVHYVTEPRTASATGPEAQDVRSTGEGAMAIISAEVDILTSIDVATNVVAKVGAGKILAKLGGGHDPNAAAGVVASGIEAKPPQNSIITISFKHPDPDVAQLVLSALSDTYQNKHIEVYQGRLDDYYAQQRDESRHKLAQLEQELKRLKTQANVLFLEDTKQAYQEQIAKKMEELWDAERELAEHKAVLGDTVPKSVMPDGAQAVDASVPADKLNDYGEIISQLEGLKKNKRELLVTYTEANPFVAGLQAQIDKLSGQKAELERSFPALAQIALSSGHGGTNGFGGDVGAELGEMRRLNARISALRTVLSNIQFSATQVIELDPKIAELQRQHDEEQKRYEFFLASLEETRRTESKAAAKANNISVVQSPTPSGLDYKKTLKLVGGVLAGFIGLGLGLAFLLEHFFDRTIKRAVEVERRLRLPVFLTIPDTAWKNRLPLPRWARWRRRQAPPVPTNEPDPSSVTALAPWQPGHELRSFAEGLRERLMTYFEINNLNLKKPKLVAVTACERGSGVSTMAGGLAAALSEKANGNVLLVNMNVDHGVAQPFHGGKPGAGLADVLEPGRRADAQVQDNLYVASLLGNDPKDKLALALSKQFNHLVPMLKASDYDYIIFDMPPVTATSPTPRLASYMDITLLVLEAEKTGQPTAARATALMRQSKANVAAVLNKYHQHVPTGLAQEI